eukprot:scaffold8385_cov21-Tisochrysis_lutea.AAC.1
MQCNTMQRGAVWGSTVQCGALGCSAVTRTPVKGPSSGVWCTVLTEMFFKGLSMREPSVPADLERAKRDSHLISVSVAAHIGRSVRALMLGCVCTGGPVKQCQSQQVPTSTVADTSDVVRVSPILAVYVVDRPTECTRCFLHHLRNVSCSVCGMCIQTPCCTYRLVRASKSGVSTDGLLSTSPYSKCNNVSCTVCGICVYRWPLFRL